MKRFALLTTIFTAVITLVLPFVGGSGPALLGDSATAHAGTSSAPIFASAVEPQATSASGTSNIAAFQASVPSTIAQNAASIKAAASVRVVTSVDTEHLAQKPVPKPVIVAPPAAARSGGGGGYYVHATPAQRRAARATGGGGGGGNGGGGGGGCPGNVGRGVNGNGDLRSFALTYNAIRVAHCLQPVPLSHFRYDTCMQTRLQWMANDPSSNPGNTWGHAGVRSLAVNPATGQYYSVAVPSRGCDGNLAGGYGNSGATVAQKWWNSPPHRASLYRPTFTGNTANVCIYFAMTHGGNGDSANFARAAAKWGGC